MNQLDFLPSQLRMRALYPDPYTYQDSPLNPSGIETGAPPQTPAPTNPATVQPVQADRTFSDPSPIPGVPEEAPPPRTINLPPGQGNPDEQYGDTSANASKPKTKAYSRPLSTTANDQFIKFLDTYPQREKPSTSQKIGGVIAAFSQDPKRVDEALYGDYNRQLEDWKTKGTILNQAANLERATNQQILTDEDRDYIAQLRAQDLERRTIEGQQRAGVAQQNADSTRMNAISTATRAQADVDALEGGQHFSDREGNMWILTKKGVVKPLDQKDYTIADKERMYSAGRMTIINDQQDFQNKAREQMQKWRLEEIEAEKRANMERDAAKPNAANTMSAQEELVESNLAAGEWVRQHPNYASALVKDTTGTPRLEPEEGNTLWRALGWDNADVKKKAQDDFNKFIRDWIANKRASVTTPPSTSTPGRNTGSINFSDYKPQKQVIMIAPDGTEGAVPESEVKRLESLAPPYNYRRKK